MMRSSLFNTQSQGLYVNQIIKYHAYNGVISALNHAPASSNSSLQIGLNGDGTLKVLSFSHVSYDNPNPTDCTFNISINNNTIDVTYTYNYVFYTLKEDLRQEDIDNIHKAIYNLYLKVTAYFEKNHSQPSPEEFLSSLFQVARDHANIITHHGGKVSSIKEQIPTFINNLVLTAINSEANRLDSLLPRISNAPTI